MQKGVENMNVVKQNVRGILLCLLLAVPAWLLGKWIPVVGGPVFAILAGMLLTLFLKDKTRWQPGVNFTSKKLLQAAVVLLGFGLNLKVVLETGRKSLPIILSTITTSLVIAFLLSVLIGISSALMGGNADPLSDLVSAVTAPVRNGVSAVADWAGGVSRYVFHYGEMEQELQDLEKKVAELEGELREGQEAIQENARLRELLGLRSKRRDLTFESAKVTARSADNWRSTLTLSKGEEAGLQPGNCVITSTGVLVGVVSKVGSHTATVSTVIDTSMEMGGIITRTNSAGVLEGDFALMKEGRLKLSYLPDGAQLVAGDEVLTSGKGDVYPSGLVVGQVEGVFSDASGMNRYAVVAPEVELDTLVEVFVVKDFDIVE